MKYECCGADDQGEHSDACPLAFNAKTLKASNNLAIDHAVRIGWGYCQTLFVIGDRVTEEWVKGGTRLTTISPDGSRRMEFIPDES